MTPVQRAILFWAIRVAIAVALVVAVQAIRGPDPFLWWLAAGYTVLTTITTLILLRRGR
ncbi:hypothetical protein [Jannaschia sp. LMIT008]|uniref:hypothetical protein n=1 Tax=Jannaschia maritima TaxID=3032585 RepID=UPI00281240A8|nr:hypothetical protein [Jannaschia sp. LMIT008]